MIVTLYKKNKEKVQKWSVEVDGSRYRSIEGFVDGAMTTSQWTQALPKNVGKKNEVSAEAQAEKEAMAKVKLKMDDRYTPDTDGVTPDAFTPMLAHKWEDQKDKIIYPCYVQPKLDGMRAPISIDGAKSRLGKPINAVPHITNTLAEVFGKVNVVFDGELYNHELRDDFNRLISLVKKNREGTEAIEYHVYDAFFPDSPDMLFQERFTRLLTWTLGTDDCICVVDTFQVRNEQELNAKYEDFLEAGYEGIMIRNNSPYVQKRTNNLLKRKEFVDGEFLITDIIEGVGNRSGMMGKFIMVTESGNSFEADASGLGGHEAYREFLANKDEYIGKMATVKYQNLTPDRQVPRFGKVIAVRDYE